MTTPLLDVRDVHVEFPTPEGTVHAVSGVSLTVDDRETLGIVGESGCGKSSLGRAILQLPPPTRGEIRFEDHELTRLEARQLRELRPRIQMILQDPRSSLNPSRTVRELVAEGPVAQGRRVTDEQIDQALEGVGLDPDTVRNRRPHQLSGGQCQRVSIARALILEPRIIVCDEPVSALDVSVQSQVLNQIRAAKERYDLSLIFIAHDLAVVRNISDRILVLYLGRACEIAPSDELCENPAHPYTALLLASALDVGESARDDLAALSTADAELPSPLEPPSGCRFRTRCPRATDRCADEVPELREIAPGHQVACHFPLVGETAPQA